MVLQDGPTRWSYKMVLQDGPITYTCLRPNITVSVG